jgi:putative ABC transport system permease protein
MDFIPILSTLRRHKIAASLIVLQIALTCAIVCNAVFLIGERLRRMDRASGLAEDEVVRIQITGIGTDSDGAALTAADLAALRALPNVKAAALTDMVPFGGSSWNTSVSTIADDPHPPINVATYAGSDDLIKTFGVTIASGRDFTPDEFVDFEALRTAKAGSTPVIITRAVAERLYPGKNAVGQAIYAWGKDPQRIVGVIDVLARPNDFVAGPEQVGYAVVFPVKMKYTEAGNYLLRAEPGHQAEVLAAAATALEKVSPNRIILDKQTFGEIRHDFFKADRAMAWLLVGVCIALLVITALGIVGLASFWVQQRTRQIGIRRALGASRGQILRYFQTENFILATLGIILGMILAYAINLWLMDAYKVPRLPAEFLPFGATLLWVLGQIAVLGPAMRAAAVPPAVATRTV